MRLHVLALHQRTSEAICINFRSQGRNHFTFSEERIVRLAIHGLLSR